MNTGKFRTTMFGGFNREDVSAYILKLANERNEYKKRAKAAEDKLAAIEDEVDAVLSELCCEEEEIAEEICEEIAEETVCEECAEETADGEPVSDIEDEIDQLGADIQQSVESLKSELIENTPEELSDRINRVLGMLESTEAQFGLLVKTLKEIKSDVRG